MKSQKQQAGIAGTLQKKFIFASMLTVTILLLALVGGINLAHCISVTGQQKRMLQILLEMEQDAWSGDGAWTMAPRPDESREAGWQGGDGPRALPGREDDRTGAQGGLFQGPFRMDDALSRRFFVVRFDEEGQIQSVDVSRIYAVTQDSAREKGLQILASGKTSGTLGGFRFLMGKSAEEGQRTTSAEETLSEGTGAAGVLVVMDISRDTEEILYVLFISVLTAAAGWIAMLLPVHALTRRAIAPVARSIERQKQFVTNAGHELKTPLAIIQTNTEALELYRGESKWTRNIRAQTVRLSGLMQNLLTLSRMDENALLLQKAAVPLGPLALEVWDNFAESAGARGLQADLPEREKEGDVQACADRDLVAQLLSILFDNAVKYTPRGGEIRVRILREGTWAVLLQSNTVPPAMAAGGQGQGTAPLDPERLFERFYRADADRSRKKGGYGIGLSAARAIAEANEGTIRAHLEEDRLVFTLRLPAVRS